ncbi:MAG: cation:dicarboxylate symporter family transporter, partial [Gammaproteobacteria bacterium]
METQDDAAPRSFLSLSWRFWQRAPLYIRIVLALVLGVLVGLALGPAAGGLGLPGQLVLRLLGALAPPLILAAIVHALMTAQLEGALTFRLVRLLILNTLVAICVGLTVANLLEPGAGAGLKPPTATAEHAVPGHSDPWLTFIDNIPRSLLGPLGDNGKVLGVIVIALAFGIALRRERTRPLGTPQALVELFLACLVRILHWVIAIVP